jgi:hypothetical protein
MIPRLGKTRLRLGVDPAFYCPPVELYILLYREAFVPQLYGLQFDEIQSDTSVTGSFPDTGIHFHKRSSCRHQQKFLLPAE